MKNVEVLSFLNKKEILKCGHKTNRSWNFNFFFLNVLKCGVGPVRPPFCIKKLFFNHIERYEKLKYVFFNL